MQACASHEETGQHLQQEQYHRFLRGNFSSNRVGVPYRNARETRTIWHQIPQELI